MLCESRGGHPGLPTPNGLYGVCGRKARLSVDRGVGRHFVFIVERVSRGFLHMSVYVIVSINFILFYL